MSTNLYDNDHFRPGRGRRLAALATLLTATFWGAALGAQEEAAAPFFQETVDVQVVNVSVTVTDEDGNPIHGLGRDDFEVLADGQKVEISNFYGVANGRTKSALGLTALPGDDALDRTASPDELTVPMERHIAILVDNSSLQKRNRAKVFRDLEVFLTSELEAEDRVLLATYDGEFQIWHGFDDPQSRLRSTLDGIAKRKSFGHEIVGDRRLIVREIEDANLAPVSRQGSDALRIRAEAESRSAFMKVTQQAEKEHARTVGSASALRYLLGSLAGVPGRKALLYVSEGLPMRPGETLYHAHYNKFSHAEETLELDTLLDRPEISAHAFDLSRLMEVVVSEAQANEVVFYAIDSAGQRTGMTGGADRRLRDPDNLVMTAYQPAWNSSLDSLRTQNLQSPLRLAAKGTGGEVLANNRQYGDFLGGLKRDLGNYYSLGFQVSEPADSAMRELEVKVRRPDAQVRYNRAYRGKTWNQRLTDLTVANAILGVDTNPLEVQIMPGEGRPEKGKFVLPVRIGVPVSKLALVPDANGRAGQVTVVLLVKDEQGNTTAPREIPLRVRIPEREAPELAVAEVNLLVGAGEQAIAVGVRDEIAGEMSTTRLTVRLPGDAV